MEICAVFPMSYVEIVQLAEYSLFPTILLYDESNTRYLHRSRVGRCKSVDLFF